MGKSPAATATPAIDEAAAAEPAASVAEPAASVAEPAASVAEPTIDYVVMRPLRHSGKDYEPGDAISLTEDVARPLHRRKVIAVPGEKVEVTAAEAAKLVELQVLGPAKK